jgi:hypothetical protein
MYVNAQHLRASLIFPFLSLEISELRIDSANGGMTYLHALSQPRSTDPIMMILVDFSP